MLAAYNSETRVTARKQTGSFYTPREVVDYMVDESLLVYLTTRSLPESFAEADRAALEQDLRQLLDYKSDRNPFENQPDKAEVLIRAIDRLKALDPAVGSGAFPMGLLQKLVYVLGKLDPNNELWKHQQKEREILPLLDDIRRARQISYEAAREAAVQELQERLQQIEADFEENEMDYPRKLFLIENCIYGVDIQPIAVQIAKLRFFISLIVEQKVDESAPNRGILPLPNLETKFIAANTLIGIDRPQQLVLRDPQIEEKEEELKKVRHEIFKARTQRTKQKYRDRDEELRTEITQFLKTEGWSDSVAKQLAAWKPYDQNASAPFFDLEWMYGIKDGFDLVIGNPPYIGEKGNKEIFRQIKQSKIGRFYQRKMDIFYFFFHLGIDLATGNGQIAYITTNYYPTATAAKNLRQDLKARTIIRKLINFNELKIFESALGQHNLITIFSKARDSEALADIHTTKRTGLADTQALRNIVVGTDRQTHVFQATQRQLYEGEDCQIRLTGSIEDNEDGFQRILARVAKQGSLLGDLANVNQGILSGVDKITQKHVDKFSALNSVKGDGVYVISLKEYDLLKADWRILKPWFKNSDIQRYWTNFNPKEYLIYPTRDIDIENYPLVFEHLLKYEEVIKARNPDGGEMQAALKEGKWWVIFAARKSIAFSEPKIVVPQRSYSNTFGYNETTWYASADVYFITSKNALKSISLKYILALLNSKIYYLWLYHKGKRKGKMLELYQKPLSQIPIKEVSAETQKPLIELADKILAAKSSDPNADTSILEHEVDGLVYQLYGLTSEEIALVEKIAF